jgi:hypothetical protein
LALSSKGDAMTWLPYPALALHAATTMPLLSLLVMAPSKSHHPRKRLATQH